MIANLIFDRETQQALDAVVTDRAIWKARLEDWCSINTGSRNLEGLQAFLRKLEASFQALPGTCVRRPLQPEAIINAQGQEAEHALSDSLHVIVRPEAPIKLVLTGHYDTVFPAQSSFQ